MQEGGRDDKGDCKPSVLVMEEKEVKRIVNTWLGCLGGQEQSGTREGTLQQRYSSQFGHLQTEGPVGIKEEIPSKTLELHTQKLAEALIWRMTNLESRINETKHRIVQKGERGGGGRRHSRYTVGCYSINTAEWKMSYLLHPNPSILHSGPFYLILAYPSSLDTSEWAYWCC